MARRNFSKHEGKREFPTALVLAGLSLVALVWLSVFHPHFVQSFPLRSSPLPHQSPETAGNQEPAPAVTRPDFEAPLPAPLAGSSGQADAANAGAKEGDFFCYTDDEGIIHLVDSAAKIPDKYRQQMKVYRDDKPVTPVRVVNNQVLVPVTLRNGGRIVKATLVLDTGCSVTAISAELAARLAMDPARTAPGFARVADGRRVPTSSGVIDQLTAGPKTKSRLEVSIMPTAGPQERADGLLGMNFLSDFRYQIDVADQQIHWR